MLTNKIEINLSETVDIYFDIISPPSGEVFTKLPYHPSRQFLVSKLHLQGHIYSKIGYHTIQYFWLNSA